MKKIGEQFLLVFLVFSLCLGGFLATALGKSPEKKHDMQVFGGRASPYRVSVALADILSKYHPTVRASAVESAGSEANIHMATEKGKNADQILFQASNTAYRAALKGVGDWKIMGLKPVTNLRMIAILQGGIQFWVSNDPKIRKMADFAGKTIAWLPGSDLMFEMFHESLRILGIHSQVKIKQMDFMAMYNALRDGTIDGCLGLAVGLPEGEKTIVYPLMQAINAKRDGIFMVPWDKELYLPAARKVGLPVVPTIMPTGSIPTQTEPAESFWDAIMTFFCLAEADEELIYGVTKTLVQQYYRFREYMPALDEVTPEIMAGLLPCESEKEVHPGALRYYKEVGLWPTAWEKYHKKQE